MKTPGIRCKAAPEKNRNGERRASRRGFTFVELAFTVAILGLLAALAIPAYLRYMEKGKESTARSDIQVIAIKLKAIMLENPDALPDSLAAVGLSAIDPWGNPYRYLRIYARPANQNDARKDHNLHPINSDFDLYSMGPDGQTAKGLQNVKSRDDIIRANDGAFVGKASTYDP